MNGKKSDTSGIKLWLVLWKAAQSVKEVALGSVISLDMCGSDFAVLELLLHKGELPVNVIGKKVFLTSGSITAAVDRLEKRKLIRRKNDPGDRRIKKVSLTAKGRKLIASAFSGHRLVMEQAVSAMSKTERATLIRLLKKLGKNVQPNLRKAEDENGKT